MKLGDVLNAAASRSDKEVEIEREMEYLKSKCRMGIPGRYRGELWMSSIVNVGESKFQ